MQKLTSKFSDSPLDMANIVHDQARCMLGEDARPAAFVCEHTPPPPYNPHKHACLPSVAWARHAEQHQMPMAPRATSGHL